MSLDGRILNEIEFNDSINYKQFISQISNNQTIKFSIDLKGKNHNYLDEIINKYNLNTIAEKQPVIIKLLNSFDSQSTNDILWTAYRLSGEYNILLDLSSEELSRLKKQNLPLYKDSNYYKGVKPAYQH